MRLVQHLRSLKVDGADVALSGALLILGYWNLLLEWEVFSPNSPRDIPVDSVTVAIACTALAFRRRAPVAVSMAVTAALIGPDLVVPTGPVFFGEWVPSIVAAYSVAAWRGGWWNLVPLGSSIAAFVVLSLRLPTTFYGSLADAAVWFLPTLAAVGAGQTARALRRRTEDLEQKGDELARQSALEERARIARELHDVIGSNVTVMVVQAEAASEVLGRDADAARRALAHVQRAGREALGELQLLLGVLRDPGTSAGRSPVPTLAHLEAILEPFRESGMTIDLAVSGAMASLPTTTDISACRVLQESLTNALKHAPGSPVNVRVDVGGDRVQIEVRNRRQARPGMLRQTAGYGLVGLRERVAVLGGTLSAATPGEDFVLIAELPLPAGNAT